MRGRPRAGPWNVRLAGELERARKDAGWSQARLAGALGCSERAVRRVERCETAPRPELVDRWVGLCGGQLVVRYSAPVVAVGGGR